MGKPKIGIYAGTFDPVHSGHISFALSAINSAGLDGVCFMPERKSRYKTGVEHFGHRAAMIARAIRPHQNLSLIELPDKHFSIAKTLPQLQSIYPTAQLVMLMGADVFMHVPDWPMRDRLLEACEFVVSVRSETELTVVNQIISRLGISPKKITIVDSNRPEVSSSRLREALRENRWAQGLLPSVQRYAKNEWLYIKVSR